MLNVPDRIKELLHTDSVNKNIRIHFSNGERSDICNDLIVKDTVEFKESLCSQNTLKFGLCEASIFQCEVVGVGNVTGAMIEVSCEIFCESTVEDAIWQPDIQTYVYQIPYGTFYVKEAKRQADMQHRKIVAYGGTANLSNENEIIELKRNMFWTSQTDYTPQTFKTFMMIGKFSRPLNDAPMTELVTTSSDEIIASVSAYDDSFYLHCHYVGYQVDSNTQHNLFYCQKTLATKTRDQIIKDLEYNDVANYMVKKQIPGKFNGVGVIINTLQAYAFQDGLFVYPYQCYEDASKIYIAIPYKFSLWKQSVGQIVPTMIAESQFRELTSQKIYSVNVSRYPDFTLWFRRNVIYDGQVVPVGTTYYTFDDSDINYIEYFEALLELYGLFGNIDRFNQLVLINIKRQFDLLPDEALYPNENLYPEAVKGGRLLPQDYQNCWYGDNYTTPYGVVKICFMTSNNEQYEHILYINGFDENSDVNLYLVYEITNNKIIEKYPQSIISMKQSANKIAANIGGVTYMPVEFVGRGLPYVEAGDTFEILTKSNDSITTIVLNRTIKGEQHLVDSYKSV